MGAGSYTARAAKAAGPCPQLLKCVSFQRIDFEEIRHVIVYLILMLCDSVHLMRQAHSYLSIAFSRELFLE